jgi:hypothetical protein
MAAGTNYRFCLLTVGRAGSTSLMNALAKFDDIAVPSKNIECVDNELVHPEQVSNYARQYSRLCGVPIASPSALIECFFSHNAGYRYCGFKSMPNRHRDFEAFTRREDIRFITLTREDIASTAASFLTALTTNSWRRSGGSQPAKLRFRRTEHERSVLGNLLYIQTSQTLLARVPRAIALTYEALCQPDFSSAALDEFFARPIGIQDPRPPTSGASYIENWDEFRQFVEEALRGLAAGGPDRYPPAS